LVSYEQSAGLFKKIGHIKKWGNPKMMMAFVFNYQGQFSQSFKNSLQISQIGLESGDHQLRGHGLHGIGLNQISIGPLDEAILNIEKSINLLTDIPR